MSIPDLRNAHLAWDYIDFGLIGFGFFVTAFVLAIVSIVKGRGGYGGAVLVGSVLAPIVAFALMVI